MWEWCKNVNFWQYQAYEHYVIALMFTNWTNCLLTELNNSKKIADQATEEAKELKTELTAGWTTVLQENCGLRQVWFTMLKKRTYVKIIQEGQILECSDSRKHQSIVELEQLSLFTFFMCD